MSSNTPDRLAENRLLKLLPPEVPEDWRRHAEVAGKLRADVLIEYSRGSIRILERGGMERLACECYGRVKGEYERLFGGN